MNQSLEIVPYLGGTPLVATDVVVKLPPQFLQLVNLAVEESKRITKIQSVEDLNRATEQQGQLMALISNVSTAQKAAATPIASIVQAINDAGKSVNYRLESEKRRIGDLLSGWAERQKAERQAEIDAAFEQKRRLEEDALSVKLDLESRLENAKTAKRLAEDLIESREAAKEINRLTAQLENAKLDIEFARTAEVISPVFHEPLVPGGRTSDKISVEIEDIAAIIAHDSTLKYFREVVKFDIKTLAAVNKVKDQLDVKQTPSLPGIKITIRPRVDVKASVRIVTTI